MRLIGGVLVLLALADEAGRLEPVHVGQATVRAGMKAKVLGRAEGAGLAAGNGR